MKTEPGLAMKDPKSPMFAWVKPKGWFHRWDGKTILDACSQDCANAINQRTGTEAQLWGDVMAEKNG